MRTIGRKLDSFVKVIVAAFAIIILSTMLVRGALGVTEDHGDSGGDAGTSSGQSGSCKNPWSKTFGGCYYGGDPGPFWIVIPIDRDGKPWKSMQSWRYEDQVGHGGSYFFSNLRDGVKQKNIEECWTYGKSAYVLVRDLWLGDRDNHSEPYGLYGGILLSEGFAARDDSGDNMGVGTKVTWDEAEAKFYEGAKLDKDGNDQTIKGVSWDANSDLTYFCSDYSGKTTSSTTSSPDITRKLNCTADQFTDKADTRSRIAVQNMSLDGSYNPTDRYGNQIQWKATGSRSEIVSDSLTTNGNADVYTLAKPGDSIRFYHSICMAVRYGRITYHHDNEETTGENHDQEDHELRNNWMRVWAIPSAYEFENKGTWDSFKSQVANVSAYENLFKSAGPGSKVNDLRDAIDMLNPTPDSNYTCNQIAWYHDKDPYIRGGYHVPGFRANTGACTAGEKTGITQTTGQKIIQQHSFNPQRMWEQNSNNHGGECTCAKPPTAWWTNYTASGYDNAWSGGEHSNRKEYKCQVDGQCCPPGNTDEYGVCKVALVTKYGFTSDSSIQKYKARREWGDETRLKTATVYVPYNFETTVSSSISTNDVVFQGASVDTYYQWSVVPRRNDKTAPDWTGGYATSTPDRGEKNETHVIMFEWLYYPGDHTVSGNTFSKKTPEQHFSSGMVPNTYNVFKEYVGDQNPTGYYGGTQNGEPHTRTIPDNGEYIGYKYCTAIAFYPSDSHNNMGNGLEIQKRYDEAGAMDAGERWNISGASCRTIAKKPNFQVWNGSVYTEGSINTSISRKWTGVSTNRLDEDYNPSSTDIFGSWADYAIIAGKKNKTMASGAMLGYNNSLGSGGYYELNGKGGKPAGTSAQDLAPETISNDSTPTGNSNINASASYHQNLARLDSRYRDKAATLIREVNGSVVGSKRIYAAKTGTQAANVNGSVKISELGLDGSIDTSNLTNDGNGLIKRVLTNTNNSKKDNTLIIVSSGTLVIDRNICYGSCSGDATKLSTYATGTSTNKAAALPQILIFAKNIEIDQNVTRVDAWLVAEGDESGSGGTLNTCYNHKIGKSEGGKTGLIARDASTLHYTNGNCGLTLVINGPVFANHIDLLRTAGAFHGAAPSGGVNNDPRNRSVGATGNVDDRYKGSVAPAEIFNLRADVYIWAYNQAQRYSEAVVTYTRELAPRY